LNPKFPYPTGYKIHKNIVGGNGEFRSAIVEAGNKIYELDYSAAELDTNQAASVFVCLMAWSVAAQTHARAYLSKIDSLASRTIDEFFQKCLQPDSGLVVADAPLPGSIAVYLGPGQSGGCGLVVDCTGSKRIRTLSAKVYAADIKQKSIKMCWRWRKPEDHPKVILKPAGYVMPPAPPNEYGELSGV
jgi:hypothetical protein